MGCEEADPLFMNCIDLNVMELIALVQCYIIKSASCYSCISIR